MYSLRFFLMYRIDHTQFKFFFIKLLFKISESLKKSHVVDIGISDRILDAIIQNLYISRLYNRVTV